MTLICVANVTSQAKGHHVYNHRYTCTVGEKLVCEMGPTIVSRGGWFRSSIIFQDDAMVMLLYWRKCDWLEKQNSMDMSASTNHGWTCS